MSETDKQPDEAPSGERQGTRSFGLLHAAVCLGVGGAVVLAINAIDWLT